MPPKKAIAALAHRLLVIIYHVIRTREPYHDLGVTYHDQRDRQQIVQRSLRRLRALGYEVTLKEVQPPESATG